MSGVIRPAPWRRRRIRAWWLLLAFHAALIACGHSWQTNVRASLVVTAHAVDVADTIAAQRFRADIDAAHGDTERVFAQYEPLRRARQIARDSLLIAEHAVDHYDALRTVQAKCAVYLAVQTAASDANDLVRLLTDAHVEISAADAAAPAQLMAVAASLGGECGDGG